MIDGNIDRVAIPSPHVTLPNNSGRVDHTKTCIYNSPVMHPVKSVTTDRTANRRGNSLRILNRSVNRSDGVTVIAAGSVVGKVKVGLSVAPCEHIRFALVSPRKVLRNHIPHITSIDINAGIDVGTNLVLHISAETGEATHNIPGQHRTDRTTNPGDRPVCIGHLLVGLLCRVG